MADPVFGFTRKDAEAIIRVIGGETESRANVTDTYDATSCYLAIATSAISAYNSGTSTLGSGTADFKYITSTNTVSTSWTNQTVYNFGTAIAVGAKLKVWRIGGRYLAVEIC